MPSKKTATVPTDDELSAQLTQAGEALLDHLGETAQAAGAAGATPDEWAREQNMKRVSFRLNASECTEIARRDFTTPYNGTKTVYVYQLLKLIDGQPALLGLSEQKRRELQRNGHCFLDCWRKDPAQ